MLATANESETFSATAALQETGLGGTENTIEAEQVVLRLIDPIGLTAEKEAESAATTISGSETRHPYVPAVAQLLVLLVPHIQRVTTGLPTERPRWIMK